MLRGVSKQIRVLIALALIVLAAYIADIPLPFTAERPQEFNGTYPIVRVSDGDTIVIERDGEDIPVRLIGVDSPEIDSPRSRVECFGNEASTEARILMRDKNVRIETDPSQDLYDAYDRLLAYVYVPTKSYPEGILVNEYMIREGFAREYTYKKTYAHRDAFVAAEEDAKRSKKGLWSACITP
jgi:micrococcal nuclease